MSLNFCASEFKSARENRSRFRLFENERRTLKLTAKCRGYFIYRGLDRQRHKSKFVSLFASTHKPRKLLGNGAAVNVYQLWHCWSILLSSLTAKQEHSKQRETVFN